MSTLKRPDGIEIDIGNRIHHLDGQWWEHECTFIKPDSEEIFQGFIQGDGHLFAPETLKDEGGDYV